MAPVIEYSYYFFSIVFHWVPLLKTICVNKEVFLTFKTVSVLKKPLLSVKVMILSITVVSFTV